MERFVVEFQELAGEGGWILWFLFVLAFGIASTILSILALFHPKHSEALTSQEWNRLLRSPGRYPFLLEKLKQNLGDGQRATRFEELEHRLFAKLRRRIPFAFVLAGAAPLMGLLGTVSGMLNTFFGMASSSVKAPVDVISRGVSEALVTTQAGLIIGIPSFIVCTVLQAHAQRLQIGFEQVRSVIGTTTTVTP